MNAAVYEEWHDKGGGARLRPLWADVRNLGIRRGFSEIGGSDWCSNNAADEDLDGRESRKKPMSSYSVMDARS